MNPNLKCIICGAIATTFFWAQNDPVCESCHKKILDAPHTFEIRYVGTQNTGSIQMVTNITSSTTTITVSTSSTTSTTTTLPPELT